MKERVLVEEDDLFKIYCPDISKQDHFSLQLVTPNDNNFDAQKVTSGAGGADITKKHVDDIIDSSVNEHGLIVLAQSKLKLEYLVQNNQKVLQSMLRSTLIC